MKGLAIIIGVLVSVRTLAAAPLYQQPSLWSGNGTNVGSTWSSQVDSSLSGYRAYDNFSLPTGGAINQATWRGIYVDATTLQNAAVNTTDWNISLQANNAGAPGSVLSSSTIPAAQVSKQIVGTGIFNGNTVNVYEFTALLPSFAAAAGTTYWFSPMSQATNFSPLFGWIQGTGGNNSSFQTANTNGSVAGSFVRSADRAFTLSNVPVLPMTGAYVPELQAVDTLLQNFMVGKSIPGGTIAITHNDKVIYERAIGYSNEARSVPMQETALMRLASVSKPVTASAIQQLAKDGQLNLNTKVFNINGNGGILNITPYNGTLGDSRLQDITVQQLLEHTGGWNRDTAGDLAFRDVQIANAVGVPSPPGIANSAQYILSQPLQFTPGTSYNYSNIGYMFLGMVVEAVSGEGYENYVDSKVLAPAEIPAWEVNAGRTFAADQNPREPVYSSPYTAQNVYDPGGPYVSSPYGGWDHDKALAFGGLIGSSKAIAQLAEYRIAAGPEIGKLRSDYTTYSSYWWYHTGSLDGTDTLLLEASWKDWTYSILFDRRPTDGSSYSEPLVNSMQSILEGLGTWPAALVYAGDFTNDQWLTLDDITLFKQALALGSQTAFSQAYPTARYAAGDFDSNGLVNESDAAGFILALQHAGVPETFIALVPELPGDYNRDGVVDAADYVMWRKNFALNISMPNETMSLGLVDQADYIQWRAHFGTSHGAGTQLETAVPEPNCARLIALALLFGGVKRCRPNYDPI
jgi:CubicO group peptidase (beta-lactamase class C family)